MRADALNETMQPLASAEPAGRSRGVTRWRAFATHLALSAALVGAVCALIFFVWYPTPYFQAAGAWNVLRVLIGVDLVAGPLLTLIVFKPGKRGLAFDLWVIALVQLTALVFGVTVIYTERPYYTVFAGDRFFVLAHKDVDPTQVNDRELTAPERIGAKPFRGPLLVAATRPLDPAAMNRLVEETVFGGKPDIERRPEFWGPYVDGREQILRRARPLADLQKQRPHAVTAIDRAAARLGRADDTIAFLPIIAKNRDMAMLLDTVTGMPLAVLDVDPWLANTAR